MVCYSVPHGHGKLHLRFVHGRAEKCIRNGAHIVGGITEESDITTSFGEKRFVYLQTRLFMVSNCYRK